MVELTLSDPSSTLRCRAPTLMQNTRPRQFLPDAPSAAGGSPAIDCGDLDMRIARDGTWFYRGSPIGRMPLVKLFASVLRRERRRQLLAGDPGRARPDHGRGCAVHRRRADRDGRGPRAALIFRTNLDDIVTAGRDHPLRVETAASGAPRPISWCAPGSRRGSRGRYSTSWWSSRARRRGRRRGPIRRMEQRHVFRPGRAVNRIGDDRDATGGRASDREIGSTMRESEARADRLAREGRRALCPAGEPGRRGFGGTADPAEAAAFAVATARRPRPQPGHDRAQHRAAAGGGAGAADRSRRRA